MVLGDGSRQPQRRQRLTLSKVGLCRLSNTPSVRVLELLSKLAMGPRAWTDRPRIQCKGRTGLSVDLDDSRSSLKSIAPSDNGTNHQRAFIKYIRRPAGREVADMGLAWANTSMTVIVQQSTRSMNFGKCQQRARYNG